MMTLFKGLSVFSSCIYDRQVIVAIAEELDPNRWKAALASDRHRRIAALIHRWLSASRTFRAARQRRRTGDQSCGLK
jgi:hypothetical protein